MEYEAIRTPAGIAYAECAPGLWFPEEIVARGAAPGLEHLDARSGAGTSYCVEAEFNLFPNFLKYGCRSLHIYIEGVLDVNDQTLIKAETYRSLRMAEVQQGLGDALGLYTNDLPPDAAQMEQLPYQDVPNHQIDKELVLAAQTYVRGVLGGRRAQKDVSGKLGVSIATAGRRVQAARDAGYLPVEGRMLGPRLSGVE